MHKNGGLDGNGEDVVEGAREAHGDVGLRGRVVRRGNDGDVVDELRPREVQVQPCNEESELTESVYGSYGMKWSVLGEVLDLAGIGTAPLPRLNVVGATRRRRKAPPGGPVERRAVDF